MAYFIEVIRKEEQITNNWSGGTTTELAIYPKDAEYSKRNFLWRISSARVEVEESTFTSLPGIWRLIMVLDGRLELQHEGHHNIDLGIFQQDSFSGDWNTKAFGRARDFNLMMAESCKGTLEAIGIKEKEEKEVLSKETTETFYCIKGEIEIVINEREVITLYEGDFLIISMEDHEETMNIRLSNPNEMSTQVIRAMVSYESN